VPGTKFLFPNGVSYIVTSRTQTLTLPWAGRIPVKSGVGITDDNQNDEPPAPGIKFICGPGQKVKIFDTERMMLLKIVAFKGRSENF
jgi:hypothetical protein